MTIFILLFKRYFDCILQEFYLKMDKGFLLSIKDWYDAAIETSTKDDKSVIKKTTALLILTINNEFKLSRL